MKIRVLFFGATRDEAGTAAAEMEFDGPVTASEAFSSVIERFPALTGSRKPDSLLIAVNEAYVPGDSPVRDGDELAIFTAVSGG